MFRPRNPEAKLFSDWYVKILTRLSGFTRNGSSHYMAIGGRSSGAPSTSFSNAGTWGMEKLWGRVFDLLLYCARFLLICMEGHPHLPPSAHLSGPTVGIVHKADCAAGGTRSFQDEFLDFLPRRNKFKISYKWQKRISGFSLSFAPV